ILSGFWLALYFTDSSFIMFWDKFLYMLIGGTLLMAGALMLNNWYEVDLDENMMLTQERPTDTGNFSLNTVLTAGIVSSIDRKSTRLNSSHVSISYAVFCLKKKK